MPMLSHKTLQQIHWNSIFCRMYGLSMITPFTPSTIRWVEHDDSHCIYICNPFIKYTWKSLSNVCKTFLPISMLLKPTVSSHELYNRYWQLEPTYRFYLKGLSLLNSMSFNEQTGISFLHATFIHFYCLVKIIYDDMYHNFIKLQTLTRLMHMQAFPDFLWRGFSILMYCDLSKKSWVCN